jgi:hypothetical protein
VRLSVAIDNKAVVATGLFLVGVSFAWVSTDARTRSASCKGLAGRDHDPWHPTTRKYVELRMDSTHPSMTSMGTDGSSDAGVRSTCGSTREQENDQQQAERLTVITPDFRCRRRRS